MYPVSAEFKSAVRGSHRALIRAEVWSGDRKVLDLQPIAGQVEVDGRRAVRRTCSLTVQASRPTTATLRESAFYSDLGTDYATYTALAAAFPAYGPMALTGDTITVQVDDPIVPGTAFDALAPFGNELRLWRGLTVTRRLPLTYGTLTGIYSALATAYATYGTLGQAYTIAQVDEYVPLGVFLITDVDVVDGEQGIRVDVQGSDRSLRVARARWTRPYQIASGSNAATAVADLLASRYDDVITGFPSTSETVGQTVLGTETENDPWRDAVKIAQAAGFDLYFDGDGVARMDPAEDYETATPDEVYLENDEAMILSLTRRLSNERTYNGVIATAEGSDVGDTFRAEAWDDDPASPTYRFGPFGEAPLFFSSPLITSQEQAQAAAESRLSKIKGATEAVDWAQIVDPSLDVGDVIEVRNTGAKVSRLMVLDRLTIPLDPSQPMAAVARTVRSLAGVGDLADEGA